MIRKQRTTALPLGRLWRRKRRVDVAQVLPDDKFQWELKKEIYRSDRRHAGREFGLIRLILPTGLLTPEWFRSEQFAAISDRLRITDVVGIYHQQLAILLPETEKNSALQVANEITRRLEQLGLSIDTEVAVYPQDDELISLADEIRHSIVTDHEDDDDSIGPGGVSESGDSSIDHRYDDAHLESDGGNLATAVAAPPQTKLRNSQTMAASRVQPIHQRVKQVKHRFVPSLPTPWWKRTIDIVGAGAGLILLSPVFIVASAAIKLSSPGPVYFRQLREGKDGKPFSIYKFRTMVIDAEQRQNELRDQSEQDGPAFKLTDDPRVTWVGKYLRKSCIDELPQLINILKGEMSLVGPRPLPVHESLACTAWQRARLTVLPGLTCTWQAYGGRDVKFAKWMEMDLEYIERQGLFYDAKLIADTVVLAVLHKGSV